MLQFILKVFERTFGMKVTRVASDLEARLADLSPAVRETIQRVQPYTMTSPERLAALCMAVEHVVRNEVAGAFVECGVWRGGSSMAAALTYHRLGQVSTDFYLFDTFEGMSQPTEDDVDTTTGRHASDLLEGSTREKDNVWAYAPLELVRRNMIKTGYPVERIHYIQGKVEETVPGQAPEEIAILRLDTDWYESTKHELAHLFPRLSRNGVIIIDDYGAWAGARKAVDEYFSTDLGPRPFLMRIDNTGRIHVKA